MRRRTECGIDAVDFPAGSAATNDAEVADAFILADTVKDKRDARVETRGRALIEGRTVEALRSHAGAGHRLRRATHAPPHATEFTREARVVFAALRGPRADAVFRAANFDNTRAFGMIVRAPVEAVATHVDEATTASLKGRKSIEHTQRWIFRMGAGGDTAIRREQCKTMPLEIVFGDDVVGDVLGFQPVSDMGVGRELPQRLLGREVEHRAQPR